MTLTEISVCPPYFQRYVDLIPHTLDLMDALASYTPSRLRETIQKNDLWESYTYAPDKWTVQQVIQHLSDTERIFAYRALRIARNDQTPLPGFEQDDYVDITKGDTRTLEAVLKEYDAVRAATLSLFDTFGRTELLRTGMASGSPISVVAIGFMIAGHLAHHDIILAERYRPSAG